MRDRILKELLLKHGLGGTLSSSFDIIGDILILRKKPGIEVDAEKVKKLGDDLLSKLRYVKTVFLDASNVKGEHRTRSLIFITGEYKTRTIYREHGLSFYVDVAEAYISPRLSYEHYRVARLVRENETVVNMFAGIGAFSIFIAKYAKPRAVYSIDINPVAYELMVKNIQLNKVEGIVIPLLGDAAEIARTTLKGIGDRTLMPLPNFSPRFYCPAIASLKREGYLHAYEFLHVPKGGSKRASLEGGFKKIVEITQTCEEGAELHLLSYRVVRSVGPRWIQGVFDIYVKK